MMGQKIAAAGMFIGGMLMVIGEVIAWTADQPYNPRLSDLGLIIIAFSGAAFGWIYRAYPHPDPKNPPPPSGE